MPVQKSAPGLFSKYGKVVVTSVATHINDEIKPGFQRVPPGITNGVARLTECGFKQYKDGKNKGEYYFYAVGAVQSPESVVVNGTAVPCQGLQTRIQESVCQTGEGDKTVTVDKHLANILQELRKLWGEGFPEFDGKDTTFYETVAAAIADAKPYFRFSTSVRKGQEYFDPKTREKKMGEDGVWENWYGNKGLENYVPEDTDNGGVADSTATTSTPSDDSVPTSNADGAEGHAEPTPANEDQPDLATLAESADGMTVEEAMTEGGPGAQLKAIALGLGISEEDFDNAPNFTTAAELITNVGESEQGPPAEKETPPAEPEKPAEPMKGETWGYTIIGKDKKKKQIEVEITAVYKKNKTVDLLNATDKKTTYKGIKWDQLIVV
jgi:hypothetical protein